MKLPALIAALTMTLIGAQALRRHSRSLVPDAAPAFAVAAPR